MDDCERRLDTRKARRGLTSEFVAYDRRKVNAKVCNVHLHLPNRLRGVRVHEAERLCRCSLRRAIPSASTAAEVAELFGAELDLSAQSDRIHEVPQCRCGGCQPLVQYVDAVREGR
jgi:hypothetical protein